MRNQRWIPNKRQLQNQTNNNQNNGIYIYTPISSVQFNLSVMADSLRPHESQRVRPPCPSPTPGVHSNSCPLIGDAIQPSHPLSSLSPPTPIPPASGPFPMSQHFTWGGQSIGVPPSASVLPMYTQDWSPLGWTSWISLPSPRDSQESSPKLILKHLFFGAQLSLWLIGKDSDAGRDWGQEEKGTTEDEMAGWHHWLNGREFEWTPGVGDGQGGLACFNSWGRKELDRTEQLNFELSLWSNCHIHTWPLENVKYRN